MAETQEFQDLTAKLNFWNNKPSELEVDSSITGKVLLIQEKRDPQSSRSATLELSDGSKVGVWLSTIIDSAFASGVNEGDTVRITYKGKEKNKKGTEFNDYKVEVSRQAKQD